MRCAIFGDIHGNTEALRAVSRDMERARVDRLLCLGDILGYGAEPVECLRAIQERDIDTVLGNHDSAAVGDTPLDYFNEYARAAVEWTATKLAPPDRDYFLSLPLTRDYDGFTVVHSSLANPKEWGYILVPPAARMCFEKLTTRVCFIGHSHVPVCFDDKGVYTYLYPGEMELDKGAWYIINVGSVGQPRDGDPRASYGIYDTKKKIVEIRRVEYDFKSTQDKIIAAGLPPFLALRLGMGR